MGFEPTASLVLSQGGLPVAYRAVCLVCPKQESNLQTLGFKPSRSASWRIRAPVISVLVVPDGLEPPLGRVWPGVVAAGPRDYLLVVERKPWDSNPQRSDRTCFRDRLLIRPDDFRFQVAGAGIEPTSGRSECPVLPLDDPAVTTKVRGAGLEPASPGSKPGSLPLADPRTNQSALWESNPPRQLGRLAPLPLGQGHNKLRRQESNLRRGD